jgi:two-component system chemotaxis response regulator CheB
MAKTRVLVVDDSVVVRRMVTDVLNSDPDIEVAGSAANGRIALAKLTQIRPDIVTLDVEMPEMDGLQTLIEIRKTHSKLPVIMFSTCTSRGAAATLDALAFGATDYVTKPANVGSVSEAQQRLREDLIPKIKQFCNRIPPLSATALSGLGIPRVVLPPPKHNGFAPVPIFTPHVIVIGISTGGPDALSKLIPALPGDLPSPVLIVQHMPPVFTKLLADRLNATSALPVKEAAEGDILSAPGVWLAPGDFHMSVERDGAKLVARIGQGPPENSCRPAADVLFRTVAAACGPRILAVVLTGMGQDGLHGCEAIRSAGGDVIIQDEASSVVWGMPGFVARAGLQSAILPLSQLADAITQRARGIHRLNQSRTVVHANQG